MDVHLRIKRKQRTSSSVLYLVQFGEDAWEQFQVCLMGRNRIEIEGQYPEPVVLQSFSGYILTNFKRTNLLDDSSTTHLYTNLYNVSCSSSVFPSEVTRKVPLMITPRNQDSAFDSERTSASMRWRRRCSVHSECSTLGSW